MPVCSGLIYGISRPCKPVWGRYTVYRGHASLFGADILYIEAMQACLGLIYCISSPASLLGADILYIEALQACLELIYCISSPNFPAPTETGGESRKIRQLGYKHSAPSGTVWRANAIRPYPGYQEKLRCPRRGRMQFAPTYYIRQIWQASLTPLTHRPADCRSLAQQRGGG